MNILSSEIKNGLKIAIGLNILGTLITFAIVAFLLSGFPENNLILAVVVGICLIPNIIVVVAYLGVTKNYSKSKATLGVIAGALLILISGLGGLLTVILFSVAKYKITTAVGKDDFHNNNYAQQGYGQAQEQPEQNQTSNPFNS